jgi:hypothetical protein
MSACTTNRDSKSGYARINLGPYSFQQPNLDQVIRDNGKKDLPIEHQANLEEYVRNKGELDHFIATMQLVQSGRVWFHELLPIDWASGVDGPYHVVDIFAMFSEQFPVLEIQPSLL